MTHVEFANDVVHLHNIEQYNNSPYNTTLGSRESLIREPRSTLLLWSQSSHHCKSGDLSLHISSVITFTNSKGEFNLCA